MKISDVIINMMETIGPDVKQRRGWIGYGIRKAAKEIGVSPTTLSRIERGHRPDIENLLKLILWLEKSRG